jgi:flagellar basal body P-ring protein FlgI
MSVAFDMALEALTKEQAAHVRTLRRHVAHLMDVGATPADVEELLQLIEEREGLQAITRGALLAAQEATQ